MVILEAASWFEGATKVTSFVQGLRPLAAVRADGRLTGSDPTRATTVCVRCHSTSLESSLVTDK